MTELPDPTRVEVESRNERKVLSLPERGIEASFNMQAMEGGSAPSPLPNNVRQERRNERQSIKTDRRLLRQREQRNATPLPYTRPVGVDRFGGDAVDGARRANYLVAC